MGVDSRIPLSLEYMFETRPGVAHPRKTHPMDSPQLLDAFATHLLGSGRGTGTVTLRLAHLKQLELARGDLLAITQHDLEDFLAVRRTSHAAQTRKSMRSSFRVFYAWAHVNGHCDHDPAARLLAVRTPAIVPRIADDVDVTRSLERIDVRDRAIVLLARLGCLRRAEVASLHMNNRRGDFLFVTGKGEKQRRVPINRQLMEALTVLEQTQPRGFYFPSPIRAGRSIHVDTIHKVITRTTGWNPHSLRHAGATASYRVTHDLRALQAMLGHASIATTQIYLHVDDDDLRAAGDATGFVGIVTPISIKQAAS